MAMPWNGYRGKQFSAIFEAGTRIVFRRGRVTKGGTREK